MNLRQRQSEERKALRDKHKRELQSIFDSEQTRKLVFRKHTKEVFSKLKNGDILTHKFRDGSICSLIVIEPNKIYTCADTKETVNNVREWIRKQTGGIDYNPIYFFGLEPWPKKRR